MIVLITGCRSGIGLATALAVARAGHTVYAGLRDIETWGALEEDLPILPVQLDVTSGSDRRGAIERVIRERGRIDALVNNAGIGVGGFVEQLTSEEIRQVFEVNVFGAVELCRAVLPPMRAQGGGVIVNISSMSGRMALAGNGLYSASKFALEGFSEALRLEVRHFGVRVALVEPGAYRTDIMTRNRRLTRGALSPEGPYAALAARLDALWRRTAERQARDPREVAERVLALIQAADPPLRSPVGPDAWLRAWALRLLPDRAIEWLLSRLLRGRGP